MLDKRERGSGRGWGREGEGKGNKGKEKGKGIAKRKRNKKRQRRGRGTERRRPTPRAGYQAQEGGRPGLASRAESHFPGGGGAAHGCLLSPQPLGGRALQKPREQPWGEATACDPLRDRRFTERNRPARKLLGCRCMPGSGRWRGRLPWHGG